MSMLDSFFNKGFKAAKCKTALKLTIPRIKLLRNRREVQLKQMRKEIAQLLQTGQEPTARIRVEHIIREQNIMAAYEIIELFSELVVVRLPIIESQRECPLDLREAIASLCFAAPRCSDLPELLQVSNMFAAKYGKEFVTAASELMPECGVNRQIIEKLSVRPPSATVKLNLMKEIAEEHEVEWDSSNTEAEFFKLHEDLLDGPNHFLSGSKMPLPNERIEDESHSMPAQHLNKDATSDTISADLDLPEVPKLAVTESSEAEVVAGTGLPMASSGSPPATQSASESTFSRDHDDISLHMLPIGTGVPVVNIGSPVGSPTSSPRVSDDICKEQQFVPFISAPASSSILEEKTVPTVAFSKTKSVGSMDLQDVLAAAQAAAESADRAAAAARAAADIAKVRISEINAKIGYGSSESDEDGKSVEDVREKRDFSRKDAQGDARLPQSSQPEQPSTSGRWHNDIFDLNIETEERREGGGLGSDAHKSVLDAGNPVEFGSIPLPPGRPYHDIALNTQTSSKPFYDSASEIPSSHNESFLEHQMSHQPQRLTSLDDDSYFSYPNLFNSQDSFSHKAEFQSSENSKGFTKSASGI